ncbi:MAG: bile acid:sodium symporter family protein [Planctomycetia bacterium]|nr:bile acid:sodium symporter family protein [Planctomycetia bacterium]
MVRNILRLVPIVCLGLFVLLTSLHLPQFGGVCFILFWLAAAILARGSELGRPFCYPLVVLGCVTSSMYFPGLYLNWFGVPTTKFVIPVLQLIMFGMGTQLSLADFRQVTRQPWGVLIGVFAQFMIMPVAGFLIATTLPLPKEVAAGIILVGCVPSGIASNVMNFLAKANMALSVTLTAVATLLGPIITPLWMKALIGTSLDLDYMQMTWDIVRLVVLPIAAGLTFRALLPKTTKKMEKHLAFLSMIGLLLTIVFINAAGRDNLMKVGALLVFACLLHNTVGYILGYWLAKACRLDERSCRTVSMEVGMQNGGLAAGLAIGLGRAATMGLAPAICSPLMNITGATLAIWWRGRPIKNDNNDENDNSDNANDSSDKEPLAGSTSLLPEVNEDALCSKP